MGYCLRHGDYGGASSCYACREDAERHQEQIDAIERAAYIQERRRAEAEREAAEESARRAEHAVANAWKLQAESIAVRAQELADAGLYEDAKATAERALAEDPGNLTARILVAVTSVSLGDTSEAERAMDRVVQLLRTASSNANALVITLSWVHRKKLDGAFIGPLKRTVRDFATGHGEVSRVLIEECAKLGWCEEAGKLLARMESTPNDVDLVDPLIDYGCIDQGAAVASSVVQRALSASRPDIYEWMRAFAAALRLYQTDRGWHGPALFKRLHSWSVDTVISLLREVEKPEGWRGGHAAAYVQSQLVARVARSLNETETAAVEHAIASRSKVTFWQWAKGTDGHSEDEKARAGASAKCRASAEDMIRNTGLQGMLRYGSGGAGWAVSKENVEKATCAFEAWISYQRGQKAKARNEHKVAATHFRLAAEGFERAADKSWAGYSCQNLGWSFCPDRNPDGDYSAALTAFREAERYALAAGAKSWYAWAVYGQAWCNEPPYQLSSDWKTCTDLYRRAADLGRDAADLELESEAMHAVAWCVDPKQSGGFGDWKSSAEIYRKALELRREAKKPADIARTLFNLACVLSRHDKSNVPPDAVALLREAIQIRRGIGDRKGAEEVAEWIAATAG